MSEMRAPEPMDEDDDTDENDTEAKKATVATSKVDGSTVTFTFATGRTVSLDVSKLSPENLLKHAVVDVRNNGRLSFQKIDDPEKAADALSNRYKAIAAGTWAPNSRAGGGARKEPDDLTVALARLTGRNVKHVEDVMYPKYFASADSGCSSRTTSDGKVRWFGKAKALNMLRAQPEVKAEIEKIAKERSAKNKSPATKINLSELAA